MNEKQTLEPEAKEAPPAAAGNREIIDTSKMSKGKAAALEIAESARDSTWSYPTFVGQLFMGRLPWDIIHPFPGQTDEARARGDVHLEQLEAFIHDKVDADQIDRDGEIPDEVFEGYARLGAFGMKIPAEYGGLGLSQVNYCRMYTLLGSHCGNSSALLSAHQSIGIPQPLLMFGTDEQKKKYLPRVAAGEVSAFALTEDGVGSDPAKMETIAEPTEDGKHFILNGTKLWCTNGTRAGLIVVMARTPSKMVRGREKRQISAFIVETDWPGVTVDRRCHFMGLRALYNGVISFKDVKVPRENIILGEGKGLRVALATLNTGRMTIPAICVGGAKAALKMVRTWSAERVQWGNAIGKHAAIAEKIAMIAGRTFGMESITYLTAALVDLKKTDIRLEAAMCKMWATEEGWALIDEALQIRGGRGYETADSLRARGDKPIPIERMLRDFRINLIFEGSSEIMRLFIAREALDPHLNIGGAVMNSRLPAGERIKGALKAAGFYALWYPALYLPLRRGSLVGMDPALRKHARYAERASRRLARALFHAMVRYGAGLEKQQVTLKRLVDIGAEAYVVAASCVYAQHLLEEGRDRGEVLQLAEFQFRESRLRIKDNFRGLKTNNDKAGYKLARRVLEGDFAWMEEGTVRQPWYDEG